MSRYNGRKAANLLDLARDGATERVRRDADRVLVMDCHSLAETVAWLYGCEPDQAGGWADLRYELGDGFRVDVNGDDISVGTRRLRMGFTPDEAVDLARALLAASEATSVDQPPTP